jgi:hypothetical protein
MVPADNINLRYDINNNTTDPFLTLLCIYLLVFIVSFILEIFIY